MKKSRVLIICNGLNKNSVKMSGISIVYKTLLFLSKKPNLELHVLSSISEQEERLEDLPNLHFHYVNGSNLLLIRLLFFFTAIKLNKKYNFELIHDYSSLPLLVGFTGILGKVCKSKTLHTIVTINTSFLGSNNLICGRNLVNKIIATDKITERELGGVSRNVIYLPLGVDTSMFSRKHILKKKTLKNILFLGSLEERKGALVLAKSIPLIVEENPEVLFTFASFGKELRDPMYEDNLKRLKELLNLYNRNVKFLTGMLDVNDLFSNTDIFVLPAISRHGTLGQPLTLLEAMYFSLPCVVSDIQEGDGVVNSGENCLLFHNGDFSDLALKINSLLINSSLAISLGVNATNNIEESLDIKITAQKLYSLYNNLI